MLLFRVDVGGLLRLRLGLAVSTTSWSIRIPRCEDYTRVRKDRAYAFEARLSSLDGAGCFEPGGADRELLRYSRAASLETAP